MISPVLGATAAASKHTFETYIYQKHWDLKEQHEISTIVQYGPKPQHSISKC